MITTTALTPTCRSITLGTSTWFSNCCWTKKKIATPSASAGDTEKGDGDGGNRRQQRPDDRNHLADAGDERQHVEVRHAQQPEPSAAVVPMMPPRSSWPPSQALTFVAGAAARILDARRAPLAETAARNARTMLSASTSK